jgi:hypothetical protein
MSAQSDQRYDDQPERHRSFSTLLSNLTPHSDDDRENAGTDEGTGVVGPQPTFTAREDLPVGQPETAADLDPVDDTAEADDATGFYTTGEPVTGTVYEAEPVDDADLDDEASSAPVPPARTSGEALPGFRRASTDRDSARGFPRAAPPVGEVAPDDEVAPAGEGVPVDEVAPAASARPRTSASVVDEPLLSEAADFRARWQQTQAGFVDDPREAVGEAADLIEQTAQALVVAVRQRQRQLRESWDATPEAHGTTPATVADTEQLRLMMQRYRALFNQLCRP